LILAAALIALAACANTLDPPPLKQEAGTGTVHIVIDGDSAGARTLAPALTITRYTASFVGPGIKDDVNLTGGSGSVSLAPGEWTITVTAFTGSYDEAGRGSATVTVKSGQTATANITPGPITGGGKKGDFRYSVTIPSVNSATLRLASVASNTAVGGTPIDLKAAAGGSAGNAANTLTGIDAGYYLMHIRLEQGGRYAGRTEVVHIYDGLETAAVYVFTNDDFFTVNTVTVSPSTVTVAKGATQLFTATVTGIGNPAQTVNWTVDGGGAETTINITTGVLSVAANETAMTLTVTATSTMDTSKSGTATVTVAMSAIEAAAVAFKSAHSAILSKTVENITVADEGGVNAALAAYDNLAQAVKDLLTDEKILLDNLKTKIEGLKAAAAFKTAHSAILAKAMGTVAISDEAEVDAALAAYGSLAQAAKDLLTNEKTLLNNQKAKIEALKAVPAFKTAHNVILSKTVGNITIADGSAVNAALTAYSGLSQTAQDLLTGEKALLDSLKAKIDTLGVGKITTLVYPTDAASGALSNSPITIAKIAGSNPTTRLLTVSGDFHSYQWRVDGLTRGSGKTFTLNAGDYALGAHQISLEVTLNGAVYSKFGSFTVAP
jgi:hypothetical protein